MKTERNYITRIVIFILVIFLLVEMHMVAYAAGMPVNSTAVVSADTKLNLRAEPQGEIIGKLARGEMVTILSEIDRNGYYFIRVNKTGQECYAYGEYLTFVEVGTNYQPQVNYPTYTEPEESEESETEYSEWENAILVVTSEKKLNMRKKPDRKAPRIKYLYFGEKLQVVSPKIKNNYILVKDLTDGKVGYVDIDYVAFENTVIYNSVPKNNVPCCECSNCFCWCKYQ